MAESALEICITADSASQLSVLLHAIEDYGVVSEKWSRKQVNFKCRDTDALNSACDVLDEQQADYELV